MGAFCLLEASNGPDCARPYTGRPHFASASNIRLCNYTERYSSGHPQATIYCLMGVAIHHFSETVSQTSESQGASYSLKLFHNACRLLQVNLTCRICCLNIPRFCCLSNDMLSCCCAAEVVTLSECPSRFKLERSSDIVQHRGEYGTYSHKVE